MKDINNKRGIFWFQLDRKRKYIRTKNLFPWLIIAIITTCLRELPVSTKVLYSLILVGVYVGQLAYCYYKLEKEQEKL